MMLDMLSIAFGSDLTKEGRFNYIRSKHSVFWLAKKNREEFFSMNESYQIEIFSMFSESYWSLYFDPGKKRIFVV